MAIDQDVKDVVVFGASLSEAIAASLEDGKLSLGDYKHFLPALGDLIPALEGIENVPEKLRNLTKEDMEELQAVFADEFDIGDDLVEEFVESAINVSIGVFDLVQKFEEIVIEDPEE